MLRISQPTLGEQEVAAAAAVIRSGQLVFGARGAEFERRLAEYLGAPECVVVSSGTAALHLSLLGLGIGPGDAVLVPDFTFPATANAVVLTGATPVFVDVSPRDYCLDVNHLARVCEGWRDPALRLRCVMPVHEFGCPADMKAILRIAEAHHLLVVEDAACALGARVDGKAVGTLGAAGCFSFHPRKILTTGEGGAVVTADAELAHRLRVLRNHGIDRRGREVDFVEPGLNYRMTDIQAAMGVVQLADYSRRLAARDRLRVRYHDALSGIRGLQLPEAVPGQIWQTYMVLLPTGVCRGKLMDFLWERGIETSVGAQCLRAQTAYGHRLEEPADWQSEDIASRGLALPFCESYGEKEVGTVVAALGEGLVRCG